MPVEDIAAIRIQNAFRAYKVKWQTLLQVMLATAILFITTLLKLLKESQDTCIMVNKIIH